MRLLFTCFLLNLVLLGFSQSPSLINYQGIARDGDGNALPNQAITLRFEILQGNINGPVIYTDNQTAVTTNSLGLFSTQIGKNGTLNQVNWQSGPLFLRISVDPAGGSALVLLGTQQIVSVPYAIHAENVPSTYTNNVLTIGSATHAISSGTLVTLSHGTSTNITVSSGPDYTISYTPPVMALSPNNASVGIVGSNFVPLPVQVSPTITPSGIATVTNAAPGYTIDVPAPNYNPNNGVLSFGNNNTTVTPTLGLSGNVLYSGPFSNSVSIPNAVTVSGTGIANVTGGPNYLVDVPPPTLALSSNNLSLSIVGSNSVALPPGVTVAGAGNIVNVSGGPTNYTVDVPNPVWTGTALILGATTTTIAPTLSLAGGTLTSGPPSNTVDLNGIGPFKQATGNVSLTTISDNVAIGLNSASAKLDVYSNLASGSVIKANNANSSNYSPALDVFSNGGLGLSVANTSSGGVAAELSSTNGYALNAQNNSASFPALYANNTSASTGGTAGYFKGGLVAESKPGGDAFVAKDATSADIFVVKNSGHVGVGNNAPTATLDVAGTVKIADGTEGAGKILMSDAAGNTSWVLPPVLTSTAAVISGQELGNITTTPANIGSPLYSFTKVHNDTKIQVILRTHLYVYDLNLTNAARFELMLGSTAALANTGIVDYFIDNNNNMINSNYDNVTVIAEFPAVPAGVHNINMMVYSVNSGGSAINASFNLGNYASTSIIVKEYR